MSEAMNIPADQLAVLKLVLLRGQGYNQISETLGAERSTVRDRAVAALTALAGPDAPGLTEAERETLTDHLLGVPEGGAAHDLLDRSADARRWTRLAQEGMKAAGLQSPAEAPADPAPELPAVNEPEPAPDEPSTAQPSVDDPRVSRTAGAILLGLLAAGAILLVLWQTGVLGGDEKAATAVTTGQATGPTTGLQVLRQVNLLPPDGSKRPAGVVLVSEQEGQLGLVGRGSGLPPSSFYALWLRKGDRWKRVGFLPAVRPSGEQKGRFSFVSPAPSDILQEDVVAVSREREKAPKAPAQIVMQGKIGGGSAR